MASKQYTYTYTHTHTYTLINLRYWQELGYLILYITGRPDVQKDYVLSFLGAHGFPLGVVACAEGLSTDSQTVKTLFLARLIKEASNALMTSMVTASWQT